MTNLAEALPVEQARCREILEHSVEIGAAGAFLAAILRISLRKAEEASAAGDVAAMVSALADLRTYSE